MPQDGGRVGLSFDVAEWAELTDGRRLILHTDLGFTSVLNTDDDPWTYQDADMITASVRSVVLPDEDDGEDHPWAWLLQLLAAQGIVATEAVLRAVPYDVELGPDLVRQLSEGA